MRVYTTRGLKEQGRFALENAHQVVDYFSEVSSSSQGSPIIAFRAVFESVRLLRGLIDIFFSGLPHRLPPT